jgi:hypothetical protein
VQVVAHEKSSCKLSPSQHPSADKGGNVAAARGIAGGYERTSGGHERTSGGYERTSGGHERTSGGHERIAGGHERTSTGTNAHQPFRC